MRTFKYYFSLAMRNLWRHKRRTLLTLFAVSLGLFSYLLMDSLLKGADEQSINNLITLETGEVRVSATGYADNKDDEPLERLLPLDQNLLAQLEADEEITGIAPRLAYPGRAGNGWDEYPQDVVGVEPAADQSVYAISDYLTQGRWINGEGYEVVISQSLADILELGLGDYLLLTTRTKAEAFQAVDLEIVGIMNTVNPTTNNQIFLPLTAAQEIIGVPETVSQIDLKLAGGLDAQSKAATLESALSSAGFAVETQPWQEAAEEFLEISRTKTAFSGVFLFMILLIATVGIVNSVLLATIERIREIGVLKAMGMTQGNIVQLFLFEAAGIGILGSLAGLLMAIGTEYYMVNVGFDLTAAIGEMDVGYPIAGVMYGAWNPLTMLGGAIFSIIVCILAGVLPARHGAKKDPVQALSRI